MLQRVLTALLLLVSYTAMAQVATVTVGNSNPVALSEEASVSLGSLPAGTYFSYPVSVEGAKTVTFEIVDVTSSTTLKSVTSKQSNEGFAANAVVTFELAIQYDLAAGHEYEARFKEYSSMSTMGKTPVAAHDYKMTGTADVAVYSTITVKSVTPSQDADVELDTPILITFSAPIASLKAKAVTGQMSSVNVADEDITTVDNITWQILLREEYFQQGTLSLNIYAKDAEGNSVTDPNDGVGLPESCYLRYGWMTTIGLPTPKLLQDGKEITTPLSTFNFMYEGIGLNADMATAKWSDITITHDGKDLNIAITEDMFKVLGDESVGGTQLNMTLPEPLKYNGEYTLVLPARSFILGHDIENMFNGAKTYSFTISGQEDAPSTGIQFNITKTNWTKVGSENGEVIGTATLKNAAKFDHFEFDIVCEEDPEQYITIASKLTNPALIECFDPQHLYQGYHYTLRAQAFSVPYYGAAPIATAEYKFVGQGIEAPRYADIDVAATSLTPDPLGGYIAYSHEIEVTFTAPVAQAKAWNAGGFDGSTTLDIVQKDAEGYVWTVILPKNTLNAGDADVYDVNIVVWDANGLKAKGWNGDNSFAFSVLMMDKGTGVKDLKMADSRQDIRYNMLGQRVKKNAKGLLIVNGKKTLIR